MGRVINLRGYDKFFKTLKSNYILIIFSAVFLISFIFGIFSLDNFTDFKDFSKDYLEAYIELRTKSAFLKIFSKAFSVSLTYIILIFIFGSSVLGMIMLPFIVAVKGMIYGSLMSELYSQYTLKGIAYNAVMVLPAAAVFVTALILASSEGFDFSLKVARLTLPRTQPTNLYYTFKIYCEKFLKITLIVLVSALIDSLISVYLSNSLTLWYIN